MLDKIKLAIRIKNNSTDDDINDMIIAAKNELKIAGVKKLKDDDPLIIQAVKLYCKANNGLDNKDYDKYMKAFESLKNSLALCGDYNVE